MEVTAAVQADVEGRGAGDGVRVSGRIIDQFRGRMMALIGILSKAPS